MKLDSIAALRTLLLGMEHDLGLDDLSPAQRDVIYAVTLLNQTGQAAFTKDILNHALTRGMSRATLFRCLKRLTRLGHLEFSEGPGHGYKVRVS